MDFIQDFKNQEAIMFASDCYGKTLLKVSRDPEAGVGLSRLVASS